jgi:hypothetical protein
MVYGFARQSNGQVRIHSAPGQGTSVKIYLPAAEQGAIQPADRVQSSPQGAGQAVLLVEDDPSVRLLIGEVLSELGYRAIEASDANAAIKVLESTLFRGNIYQIERSEFLRDRAQHEAAPGS